MLLLDRRRTCLSRCEDQLALRVGSGAHGVVNVLFVGLGARLTFPFRIGGVGGHVWRLCVLVVCAGMPLCL
jgi:hypothetical protein